jgi:predicted permease
MGRTIRVHSSLLTVIGIVPEDFQGVVLDWGRPPDVWLLMESLQHSVAGLSSENDMLTNPRRDWLLVVGSLKNGVTRLQAQANLESLNARLGEGRPEQVQDRKVVLLPTARARFWPTYRSGIVTQLSLFMLAVALVLSVACMNLVNLSLAQAMRRRREIALRMALGAGRLRLVRQLVIESVPLALLAGALGVLLAHWLHGLIMTFPQPFGIPLAVGSPLHPRVLLFALIASAIVAVICGALPALHATRMNLVPGLQTAAPSTGLGGARASRLMTIGQIAVALMLIIGGGLLIRNLRDARSLEIARDPERLLVVRPNWIGAGFSREDSGRLLQQLLERTRTLSMIQSAALVRSVPLRDFVTRAKVRATPGGSSGETAEAYLNVVSPGFFQTMGITILRGRDLTDRDREVRPLAAVINEQMAARFWPGENPLGKGFTLIDRRSQAHIVGVVRDGGRQLSVRETPRPVFYSVDGQQSRAGMSLLLRFGGTREAAAAAVHSEVQQLHPGLPPPALLTMEERLSMTLSPERVALLLFNSMAILAGLVAVVGLYGVISFSVSTRTREIGVRLALGARTQDIHRWVMKEGLVLLGAGVLAGLAGSVALTRWMQSLFHGLKTADLFVYTVAIACLGGSVLLACYLPARRATRVDPVVALKHE